jgi:nucleotide-binding universal stress UspA family protein
VPGEHIVSFLALFQHIADTNIQSQHGISIALSCRQQKIQTKRASNVGQGFWQGALPISEHVKEVVTMKNVKKILVPLDLTENAAKIIPFAVSFSEKLAGTVCLLHVVEDLQRWGKLYVPHMSMNSFQNDALDGAKRLMKEFCGEHMESLSGIETIVVSGDPASEILRIIDTENIGLVIMGTHGRKGLEHLVFGSVARQVVKKSPVPVLTLNPNRLD